MILIDMLMLYWYWFVVVAVVLLFMVVTIIYVLKLNRKLSLSKSELEQAQNLLEFRVQERTSALEDEITQRKQSNELILNSERKFHSVFENANDAIFLMKEDRFVDCNPKTLEMFGCNRDEILERSLYEFLPSRQPDGHDSKEKALEKINATLAGNPQFFEWKYRKLNGVLFDTEVSLNHMEIENEPVILAIVRDTTERKTIQAELQQQEERHRSLFNTMNEGLCLHEIIYDKSGKAVDYRILDLNSSYEKITGISREKAINSKASDLYGTDEPPYLEIYAKVAETGEPYSFETYFPPMDKYLNISATSPKKDHFATVFSDITERKKIEQQLIVTDRLASIGELASGIAHEINNPMTGIIGLSELLLDADVPEDIRADLKMINSEAQRTSQIVRNLLTFASKHKPEKQPMNINDVIQPVLELRAYELKVNNITVNTKFAPDLPEVLANEFQLQQVFLNIIINAEHFMIEAHGNGTLTITTEHSDDVVRVSFSNDGSGIPRENLARIFDPFFTTKDVGKGTGLGLSISYGIIAEHGGRIYAESEVGNDTTFVVELPINKV